MVHRDFMTLFGGFWELYWHWLLGESGTWSGPGNCFNKSENQRGLSSWSEQREARELFLFLWVTLLSVTGLSLYLTLLLLRLYFCAFPLLFIRHITLHLFVGLLGYHDLSSWLHDCILTSVWFWLYSSCIHDCIMTSVWFWLYSLLYIFPPGIRFELVMVGSINVPIYETIL